MTARIRRTLLASGTAVLALALLPAVGAMAPAPLSALMQQQAQARGGSDDGNDSGSDDSHESGRDDSGRGSGHHDSSDDGPDHDKGDDHGGDRAAGDSDDSADDDRMDDGEGGNRDEIRLIVNDAQLQGLLNGSMVPVDQNGKRLRFETEAEHGRTEIKLRAPKGTLTGVTVIPAP
ncbi:hypothetical protein [Rhizobium wuzhouense]|uniref:Uncharacterized protein n=1 Tax=Rhizobium wuzhouense TaxID=1986026 RepID=A0ABX5P1L3_9HYPH|nr:hypothetical protein [Rhizobium wuzhouense]PYB77866.1 hypothetical protein DMY87_05890 [Rhizobium wuzhouense]